MNEDIVFNLEKLREMEIANEARRQEKRKEKLGNIVREGDPRLDGGKGVTLVADAREIPAEDRGKTETRRKPTAGEPRPGDVVNIREHVPKPNR